MNEVELLEYCKNNLDYNHLTGEFKWIRRERGRRFDRVGRVCKRGYIQIMIKGKNYSAHRLAFLMHNGYLPKIVDHINRNTQDNSILNLRASNHSLNNINRTSHKGRAGLDNYSRFKGVTYSKQKNKWIASIKPIGEKSVYLGSFDNEIDCARKYDEAVIKYHGEHGVTNEDLCLYERY